MGASGVTTPSPSPRKGEKRPTDRRQILSRCRCCSACLWKKVRRLTELERLTAFVHGQQIAGEFPRYRQRGTIAVSALQFPRMQSRQLGIPSRRQFGGFDQRCLQPMIALFGNRAALLLVG